MKVIFYIGHHKVGSTALQMFLSQNFHRLLRHGILYPPVETQGFSHALALAMNGEDRAGILPVNIREPHSALAYRMMAEVSNRTVPGQFQYLPASGQMLHALRNQLKMLEPRCVLLCSEAFANFGEVAPDLISRLCDVFPGAEFQIYCVLRRIDDYLVSWHGQRLKAGEKIPALCQGAAAQYLSSIHFDYSRVIGAWLQKCPGATFTLRNYRDILAVGGSNEDFMLQAEIDFPPDMIPAGQVNPSIPHALIEIARRGNAVLEPPAARALRNGLLAMAPELDLPPNAEVEMFGAENRALLAERFAPIHVRLGDLTGIRPFFPDIDEIARPRPLPEREAMRAVLAVMDERLLRRHMPPAAAEFVLGLKQAPPGD